MDMKIFGKKTAQLCTVISTLSILLMPVQAADIMPPSPSKKPVMIDGALVPLPSLKPIHIQKVAYKKISEAEFRKHGFNFTRLFSFDQEEETHPNGFKPISAKNSKLYAQIFEQQVLGDISGADQKMTEISDDRLTGHILYQRFLQTSYDSNPEELKSWMEKFYDYPGADNIYDLAKSKGATENLKPPVKSRILSQVKEPTIIYAKKYRTSLNRTNKENEVVRGLFKTVSSLVKSGENLTALTTFKESAERRLLDNVEHDQIQTTIAKGLLYNSRIESALKLAKNSADRSGEYVPSSAWVAGLSLWKKGDYENAAHYFEMVGGSSYSSGWLSSAGYFWAARSYAKIENNAARQVSLEKAAKHSRTFYGLLAAKAMGRSLDFSWDTPEYSKEAETLILSHAAGQRAVLLVGAEQYDLAEAELMRLPYKKDKELQRAVLAYASRVGLPGIALRLGNMVKGGKGKYYDSALYPVSPWMPEGGYKLDPALVHAVIRQESRFDLNAKSYSGAMGLMQVMPKTAQYVIKKNSYDVKLTTAKLRLPETNMKIGQDYLAYLLNGKYVKGNMVDLLVAYNAGPGNLLKWRARMNGNDDPLFFIETLPVKETLDYVERVMSNYWIYRHRAGLDLPTLSALSSGKAPKYAHVMQAEYPYKLAAR